MKTWTRRWIIWLTILVVVWPLAGAAQAPSATFETVTFATVSIGFTAATIRPTGGSPMTSCSGS